jgi:cell division protein FtsB
MSNVHQSSGKVSVMASKRKSSRGRSSRYAGYNKVRARTERMHTGVRLAFCILLLMGCVAFMATALQPYRELKRMKSKLGEVAGKEVEVVERKDAKQRELRAIEEDPAYLELIARDRLDYYLPGERVFRIDR